MELASGQPMAESSRQQLKLLVKDVVATKTAYGPYATPVPADALASAAPRVLRGVKCLVLLGRPSKGALAAAKAAGVRHVVVVAAAPGSGAGGGGFPLGGFMGLGGGSSQELKQLPDAEAEAAVRASGLPYSVVQVYGLVDAGRGSAAAGGGAAGVQVVQRPAGQSAAADGGGRSVSREALGALVAGLVDEVPTKGRTLQAQGTGGGSGPSTQQQQEAVAALLEGLVEDV
ncbi:hypothetical protein GPECTOR_18g46 [Gonium pectorale]|uniref:Uncharacterized protein n=1 Tax=Gonium pectorale TaxID=33097 RepID=A0A150GJX4_GONPE|nr:hypothetical protein GPECTOR_18g46 [Gonium pectorale]|eukprot:KXZ50067.1 hypothetical protein GPECTOR_18g46 [Gonium pectorale]